MDYQFGLIGYPIEHSLSPWIHKQLLNKAKFTGDYNILELKPDELSHTHLNHSIRGKLNGFNVTVPYKEKIIPFLDDLDEITRIIGAVNTVVNENGKWKGFNTDGVGYLRSLETKYPNVFDDKTNPILIIGAGGAARGIYYSLLSAGFTHVDITNRTLENAKNLAMLKQEKTQTLCLSIKNAEQSLDKYQVIIQTTSVGMKPKENESIMKLDKLRPDTIVSDIVYQPIMTRFLKQAKEKGAFIHLGHTMLLYQAQYAFEIWTRKSVPIDNMEKQLQAKLEGK